MIEWTLVTIPTTSIGEMKFAPDMLLALVGLRIRRLAPSGLLGLAFPLGMGFGFALREYRSCIIRFSFPFVGFPASRRWCRLGWSSKKVLPFQHLA